MQSCIATLNNGQQCHFLSRYNGYCGHHKNQINMMGLCSYNGCNFLTNCNFCYNHDYLNHEHISVCCYLNCNKIISYYDMYCFEHELVSILDDDYHINNMSWGPSSSNQKTLQNKVEPKIIILLDNIDDKCSICLEEFEKQKEIYQLKCNHYFHKKCLSEWMKFKNTCPLDRKNIE